MTEHLLIGLAAIIVFGVFVQWISWYFKLPSILLLLLFGFFVGPITGLLNPDEFFGDLLFPFVSISVAIILFEGGLSLKLSELKPVFGIVRNLITIGTIITWSLSTAAAYYFIKLPFMYSLLLGAILVVTGPTVIMPILRLVKPKGQINSILKWEGIVNDPIGAILALLAFDIIIAAGVAEATYTAILIAIKTFVISSLIGVLGAFVLVYLIKKDYIPDYLQNPATLATLVLVFASSNFIQSESGLFAVTLMGIYLANQKQILIEHIIEFKENLGVLLLSSLFIVLAARLKISDLELINFGTLQFIIVLIIVIRPATIFFSTLGSNLTWKEKLYLSFMAPRGIVAAAVASIFSLELAINGYEGAEVLVPIMFIVIVATILVYGLSAIPLARVLKLSDPDPQGILIAGINNVGMQIYKVLQEHKIRVLFVDNSWDKVTLARQQGYDTCFGSIVSEKTIEQINLEGIGKFIGFTPNKGVNSFAAIYYAKIFGNSNVFQVNTTPNLEQDISKGMRRNFLSSQNLNFPDIEKYDQSLIVKANKITTEFTYQNFVDKYQQGLMHPLFVLSENKLKVFSDKNDFKPEKDDLLISLIFENNQEEEVL